MDTNQFSRVFPNLFHMAEVAAWDKIRARGLLSVSALCDLYRLDSVERYRVESERRKESVILEHRELGRVVIRDQCPLDEGKLAASLDDMSVTEWLQLLNRKVFFWLDPSRLDRLLAAKPYRDRDHLILWVDSAPLIAAYGSKVRVSPINSGSVLFQPARRGSRTFSTIEDYPFEQWRRQRHGGPRSAAAELVVDWAVPDVIAFTSTVEIRGARGTRKEIWRRETAAAT